MLFDASCICALGSWTIGLSLATAEPSEQPMAGVVADTCASSLVTPPAKGRAEHSVDGWHARPGLRLVTVISGTLDGLRPRLPPRRYGPGEPYVGGDRAHAALTEGGAPVTMAVTCVMAPGQSMDHLWAPNIAPTGCGVKATA